MKNPSVDGSSPQLLDVDVLLVQLCSNCWLEIHPLYCGLHWQYSHLSEATTVGIEDAGKIQVSIIQDTCPYRPGHTYYLQSYPQLHMERKPRVCQKCPVTGE